MHRKKERILFFISCFITTIICLSVFFVLFKQIGNTNQIFHEIIIETLAKEGGNKTGEINLFYAILILGICLFTIFFFLGKNFLNNFPINTIEKNENQFWLVVMFLVPFTLR